MTEITIYKRDGTVLFKVAAQSVKEACEARGAYLGGADLRGADLRGADLRGAYLRGAYLRGAYLGGADLRGADLRGADLRGADLRGADLRGAYLRGADLRGADLRGAYLRGADLGGAYLRGADLGGADLRGADLVDGGQDRRGYRFWAWRHEDGSLRIEAGCHSWANPQSALDYYSPSYPSNGDREECLARVQFLIAEMARRWPIPVPAVEEPS